MSALTFIKFEFQFDPATATGANFSTTNQKGFLIKYSLIQLFNIDAVTGEYVRYNNTLAHLYAIRNGNFLPMPPAVRPIPGGFQNFYLVLPIFETVYPYAQFPPFDYISLAFNIPAAIGNNFIGSIHLGVEIE